MKKRKFAVIFVAICLLLTTAATPAVTKTATPGESNLIMQPQLKIKPMYDDSSPDGYSPAQIKTAYSIDSAIGTGKGKTIAVITAFGSDTITDDLNVFDTTYNLPAADLTIHNDGAVAIDPYWALETSMDVEWAHAIAPDAKILLVVAPTDDGEGMLDAVDYAVDNGANIVTMSWGSDEDQSELSDDSHFAKSGVIFLASAGDDGAGAIYPATSPYVISVGGTTLDLDSSGKRISETGWSSSGGGKSLYESAPAWQDNFGASSDTRATPDVSAIADPENGASVYCSATVDRDSGWFVMGGTSLSAPVWAGIIACLNQNANTIANVGTLYTMAGGTGYINVNNSFYDITSGSNGYTATVGFDQVTGLGTPRCSNMVASGLVKGNATGVSYSAHVQKLGWKNAVTNGTLAGTTGKGLRVEGLKVKLLGSNTAGASISYQAFVQKKGWMAAVSNGVMAGTSGLGLRIEALRMTISGLTGYSVQYRTYVQKRGWMSWKTTANGKAITAAPIAGTMGQSLRIEAVEIKLIPPSS